MKDNFTKSLNLLLSHSGGFSRNPEDPEGATNLGISQHQWSAFLGKKASVRDMKGLTKKDVEPFYKTRYWNTIQGDELPAGIDYVLFDFAASSSPYRAIRFAQEVLNINVDGILGPKTLKALQEAIPALFIEHYLLKTERYYKNLPIFEAKQHKLLQRNQKVFEEANGMLISYRVF